VAMTPWLSFWPAILKTRPAHCDIELWEELTRGRAGCNFGCERRGAQPNVEGGVGIDQARFVAIPDEAFA